MGRKINLGETKGIVRKLDDLGGIVIPREYRKTLDLKVKDNIEIFLLQDGIFVRKVQL